MRTLLLLRHAKSDWSADYSGDHDRPLNSRGLRDAPRVGEILTERGLIPDLVISSTAVRARTTAELAMTAGGWPADLELDESLYASSPSQVLALIDSAPDVETLMLVGHQPTWSAVTQHLTGEWVDIKTATTAHIEADRLVAVIPP